MKMDRKPTYAGKVKEKDEWGIFYWAFEKTARERLEESWRLHCLSYGVDPAEVRLDKTKPKAWERG